MANENHKPVIAILGGTGAQGSAPALRWANAGYSIVIGSRSSQKAIEVCKRISAAVKHANVSYEDNQIAAEKGDVVVLSVPYASQCSTEANRRVSKVRVHVEHSIAGVKVFRSVRDIYRNFKAGFEDTLIETACGLHNLRSDFPIEAWLKAA